MDAILLLIALTAVFGVLVMPALRRRREREAFERSAAGQNTAGWAAASGRTGPQSRDGAGPDGVRLSKDGEESGGAGDGALHAPGLVPADQLDVRLPGPDPELVGALEETQRSQDWHPVGRLLALTTDDPELRWQRVQSLAGAAAVELAQWRAAGGGAEGGAGNAEGTEGTSGAPRPDAGWLRRWRTEEPHDAGGAQVYAQFLVWQAMAGPETAERRIILDEARTVCGEAARLAPDDPMPLITELFIVRGLGAGPEEFEALWQRVTRLAPGHMGAHLAALPHWSEKWHGSRKAAESFARHAAATAPPGSLLPALPLFAVYDHLPDVQFSAGVFQGAVVSDALEGARFALHQARPGHPVVPHVRHLLLWFLVRAEQYTEAAEHVRAVDGYVGAVPWVDAESPATAYAAYRATAIARQ